MNRQNIVLIGMPGVGKSTVGVLLAKYMSMPFLDTDLVIQSSEGKRLWEIISECGMDEFRRLEERYIIYLEQRGCVIATGGSVVYSERSMTHLRREGVVVHLDLAPSVLKGRFSDLDERGVVRAPGQTIEELYEERRPLYMRHADITIPCEGLNHEDVVKRAMKGIGGMKHP